MRHVWNHSEWKDIQLGEAKHAMLLRSKASPKLGDLSVRDLCCLARSPWLPVGIYVFTLGDDILYTGKTHGRSFHERMLSHIDHRDPIAGSPHLAQLVQSMVKKGEAHDASEAVERLLDMHITWMPVPRDAMEDRTHKSLIAVVERRLLWHKCFDPKFNSPRVKRNDSFNMKGTRYHLREDMLVGEPVGS